MQTVELIDDLGRKRKFALEDDDDPKDAAKMGIDIGVPDLMEIDWEGVAVRISNKLYDAGVFTQEDFFARNEVVDSAVRGVVVKAIIKLYGV